MRCSQLKMRIKFAGASSRHGARFGRLAGQIGEPGFERRDLAFQPALAAPEKNHVKKDHGKDNRIGGEQVAEVLHRQSPASASASSSAKRFSRARMRSVASRSIRSHAKSAVKAAIETSSVA